MQKMKKLNSQNVTNNLRTISEILAYKDKINEVSKSTLMLFDETKLIKSRFKSMTHIFDVAVLSPNTESRIMEGTCDYLHIPDFET